jgi:hypothetical protein
MAGSALAGRTKEKGQRTKQNQKQIARLNRIEILTSGQGTMASPYPSSFVLCPSSFVLFTAAPADRAG